MLDSLIIDTALAVTQELVYSLPSDGTTEDWLYWAVGASFALVGIFAWYKKQNKKGQ